MKYKPLKVKPIKFHLNLDTDRDKVPDWKDCQPFNPHKQGWWHDIKKKATGKVPTSDLEDQMVGYDEKSGEYELKEKKKKRGEKGYITEGAEELGQDIVYAGKKTVDVGRAVGKGMKTAAKKIAEAKVDDDYVFGGGIRTPTKNIKETLKVKKKPSQKPVSVKVINRISQPSPSGGEPIREAPGMPPYAKGFWRGPTQPQQQYAVQEIPEEYIEQLQLMEEERKLPPGTQRYAPVTRRETSIPYRPVGRTFRPTSSRPPGLVPVVTFKPVYFGRRKR